MCDTEILEPWERGRQKGKVNAAVGSVQRQAEARSHPWKRRNRRADSRNLWKL